MNEDLQGGANSLLDSCSVNNDDEPKSFAAELDGGGFVTSIVLGGEC